MNKLYKKLKAYKLLREDKVKKDLETGKRIYFVVKSTEEYSVFFDKEKDKWFCDCKYFSLKLKECSHIIACKLYLKTRI
ncbi:MAG: hypothetical protein RMJ17_01920 [Candidatus Aenigmarchaeota archaeon]|nr:hypothetical protein [Candidatus Aenigmarchaeota archaeon]MDW8149333.1 hypothetical protein [Candidatus Aenigmarchaeota archaeon]